MEAAQAEKMRQARMLKSQEAKSSTRMKVGTWTLYKLDDYNWCLTSDEEDSSANLYYPTFEDCLCRLLREHMEEHLKQGVLAVFQAIQKAKEEVLKCLQTISS